MTVNTVNGPISPEELGRTLIHEHIAVGFPGWESDTQAPQLPLSEIIDVACRRVRQLQEAGFSTFVDPVPNDLHRNVELFKAVADRTGFNIIFATGLYYEQSGGSPYWRLVMRTQPDAVDRLTALFVGEIENGVGTSGLKPGVIKVATGHGAITSYEEKILKAAGRASAHTGIPILTHTEGSLGPEQLAVIESEGAKAGTVLVGHSDESPDREYHQAVLSAGSYIGFDRFGNEYGVTDAQRAENILALRDRGQLDRLLVSSDSVWHWYGQPIPPPFLEKMQAHFANGFDRVPKLLADAGLTSEELDTIFTENPRRFLSGQSAT